MQCNIDARERMVRRTGGIFCCALGAAVTGAAFWVSYRAEFLAVGIVLILSGLFQLFEARKGWCAIRIVYEAAPMAREFTF